MLRRTRCVLRKRRENKPTAKSLCSITTTAFSYVFTVITKRSPWQNKEASSPSRAIGHLMALVLPFADRDVLESAPFFIHSYTECLN